MYRIELQNKKTKEVITFDNISDLNNGEKLFYKFSINASSLEDGEYTLSLFDGDNLIATDTLCIGDFDVNGLQYKRGESIYIENILNTNLEDKNVRITEVKTTVLPSDGIDAMRSVIINAQPVYDNGVAKGEEEGYNSGFSAGTEDGYKRGYDEGLTKGTNDGYTDGFNQGHRNGINEQKAKLTSIDITENGTYSREDGYNEVNVNVQGKTDFSVIGYSAVENDECNSILNRKIKYSKDIYNNWYQGQQMSWDDNVVYAPLVDTSEYTSMNGFFSGCSNLTYVPLLDTKNATDMDSMFSSCTNLQSVPLFDTSNVTKMDSMFYCCYKLQTVPEFDTSNVTNMSNMFYNCPITTVPQFNTSNVTSMENMFYYCTNLQSIPLFDTSNVTTMSNMLHGCNQLKEVSKFNTSNCTDMSCMFAFNGEIESVPLFDTSKVTKMDSMFYCCNNLKTVPQFDTSNVTTMSNMFNECYSLTRIDLLDGSSLEEVNGMFGYNYLENITWFAGLKDIKIDWYDCMVFLPNLTYYSVRNILNNLYDFRGNGDYDTIRIVQLHSNHMAMLSQDDIAIATNKGWIIEAY